MVVRLLSPRTAFVIVAALFLIWAPQAVPAQPATHSGVFKMDANRSVFIWDNRGLSVGTQNVLVTVCVTTGQGVNVTVDGGALFGVGVSSPPFDAPCRTGDVQVARTIELTSAVGHVEGTYTVSTFLK